jgi:hypothetical protein
MVNGLVVSIAKTKNYNTNIIKILNLVRYVIFFILNFCISKDLNQNKL